MAATNCNSEDLFVSPPSGNGPGSYGEETTATSTPNVYESTLEDIVGSSYTITPTGDLMAWNIRNRDATTATIQVNGGSTLILDVGEYVGAILTGEEFNDVLNDTVVIDPGDGTIRLTTTRRL